LEWKHSSERFQEDMDEWDEGACIEVGIRQTGSSVSSDRQGQQIEETSVSEMT
jgi:hypothetical protein